MALSTRPLGVGDRRPMARVSSFFFVGAMVLVVACSPGKSDDNGGGPPASSCEGAMTHLCERVCQCNAPSCRWVRGGALGGFTSQKACTDYFIASECKGGGTAGFDYGGCSSGVDAAACVDNPVTKTGKVLEYPTSCPAPL